jgi:hypothetical protein
MHVNKSCLVPWVHSASMPLPLYSGRLWQVLHVPCYVTTLRLFLTALETLQVWGTYFSTYGVRFSNTSGTP